MSREDVGKELHRYITDQILSGEGEGLHASTRLLETGIIDSMAMVELIGFVEQRFDVRIPDTEVRPEAFATIERIADLVLRLRRPADGPDAAP